MCLLKIFWRLKFMIINGEEINLFNLKKEQVAIHKMARGLQGVIRFNGYSDWSVAEHSFLLAKIVETVAHELIKTYIYNLRTLQNIENENVENGNSIEDKDSLLKENDLIVSLFLNNKNHASVENKHFHALQKALLHDFEKINLNYVIEEDYSDVKKVLNEIVLETLIHDFSEALTGDVIKPFKLLIPQISELEEQIDHQIREIHGVKKDITPLVYFLDKQIAMIEMIYLTRFYGKTLINEVDKNQIKIVAKSFYNKHNEKLNFLTKFIFNEDLTKLADGIPLSDKNLFDFLNLNQSHFSFDDIKNMSKETFLQEFVKYAVSVS